VNITNMSPHLLSVETIAKMAKAKRNGENDATSEWEELKSGAGSYVYNFTKNSTMRIL
jgi:hypothetical protein